MAWVWFFVSVVLAGALVLEWKYNWIDEIKQFLDKLSEE
jgi:hypothetical protein